MRQGSLRICPSPGGQEKNVISCILNTLTDLQKQCELAVVLNLNHLCLSFRTHCFVLTLKRRLLSRILFFKRSHSLVFASSCFFIMLISSGESISSLLMLPGESISFKGSLCFLAAPARRLVAHSSSLFLCSSRNSWYGSPDRATVFSWRTTQQQRFSVLYKAPVNTVNKEFRSLRVEYNHFFFQWLRSASKFELWSVRKRPTPVTRTHLSWGFRVKTKSCQHIKERIGTPWDVNIMNLFSATGERFS